MSAEEVGALVLVEDYYFMHGFLPKTDEERARICRMSRVKFVRIKPSLMQHFDAEWRSAELDAIIGEAEEISAARREAGRKGGAAKALANATANAIANDEALPEQNPTQLQTQLHLDKQSEEPSPSPAPNSEPRAREATEIAAECLAVMPISMKADPRMRGFTAWIERLHAEGVDKAAIIEGVTRSVPSLDGPPATFEYFRPAIDRAAAAHTQPRGLVASLKLDTFEKYLASRLEVRRDDLIQQVGAERIATLHAEVVATRVGFDEVLSDLRKSEWMQAARK